MKKTTILYLISVFFIVALTGCGGTAKIADFNGTWKQINSTDDDFHQEATVSGDVIEIYDITNGGDTKYLYWSGTFIEPSGAVDVYSWESVKDEEKTKNSIMASQDDTKTFEYKDGYIQYSMSILGTTTNVKLEKTK